MKRIVMKSGLPDSPPISLKRSAALLGSGDIES